MSVQTSYLVDGTWTTRRVGIGDILARTTETSPKEVNPERSSIPATALLSRTIVHGPMIQWVLPARIRHQRHNDVIFVGHDFIQIKELVDNCYLEDVTTKSDFDAKILSANVIKCREITLEMQIKQGIEGCTDPSLDSLPPQLLVLVLSSREVVFLYAREGPWGRPEFIHTRRPLPADVSSLEQYGRCLAVDPSSKAMAISAAQKFLGIFTLKPPAKIQSEMENGAVNPIQEECFFRVDGDIISMEFLYPPPGDHDRLILLMVISRPPGLHVVCYDWKSYRDLRSKPKVMPRELPPECPVPAVLIPLTKITSFLLVTPKSLLLYKSIAQTEKMPTPTILPLDDIEDSTPGSPLLWTAWARPMRNSSRNRKYDDIYLCREDGHVLYLEIAQGTIHSRTQLGPLDCNIDTAFAIIDGGYEAGDLLVAAGSRGDGGLFVGYARQSPRRVQKIPNWAPILDSIIIKASNFYHENYACRGYRSVTYSHDRIFACSNAGTGKDSVTELRHGLEAQIGLMIDQEDSSSILDVWAVPDLSDGGTFFLFSDALSSSLILVPMDASEDPYALDEEMTGLDFKAQTLSAGTTSEGVLVQVTNSSLYLTVLGDQSLRYSERCQYPSQQVIVAAVHGRLSLFAVAIRNGNAVSASVREVGIHDDTLRLSTIGESLDLTCEPLCFAIEQLGSVPFLLIGTSDGKLLVSRIDRENGIVPLFERNITFEPENDEPKACECIRVITVQTYGRQRSTLFCGLRNGSVVPFEIDSNETTGSIEISQNTPWKLGNTPVRIRGYDSDRSYAIVSCGERLWRITPVQTEDSTRYVLDSIWITDRNNPARMQTSVGVFTCIDPLPHPTSGGLGGSLVCITSGQLSACTLSSVPKTVPRHIRVPGRPQKIIYSEFLRRFVVGYEKVDMEVDSVSAKRFIRPCIDFIDPDSENTSLLPVDHEHSTEFSQSHSTTSNPTGASGEIIKCMLDWNLTSGQKEYHMIVIGTKMPLADPGGRLIYIVARPNIQNPEQIDSDVKYVHTYKQPIQAIAPFGKSSLVLGVGDEIVMQTLDESKKWRRLPRYKLEAPAVSVSVVGSYIYVLTSRHSLCILKVEDEKLSLHGQDGSDREGLTHLHLENKLGIIMTSNEGGAILGLNETGIIPDEKLIQLAFEVHMPLSVRKLNMSFKPITADSPADVAYGTTINGTVYRFTTLGSKEWRLLRFIQNICMKDPLICPFSRRRKSIIDEFDLAPSKPTSFHLNGDILSRVVERGVNCLRSLMEVESMTSTPHNQRLQKFLEFAVAVVGPAEDPFVAVIEWMDDQLRISN